MTEREFLTFEHRHALLEKPVILSGAAAQWPAMPRLALSEMKRAFGTVKVPVRATDDEFQSFFDVNPRDPVKPSILSLAEYVDAIERGADPTERPPYAHISILPDSIISPELRALIADCHFPELSLDGQVQEHRLWIAACGQRSTIHNDPSYNLNAQIAGRKRFIAFAPDQHPRLYPVFFYRWMWVSPVDPTSPDLTQYPEFANACGLDGELLPGDVLYLPKFWWHCAAALTPSVNINQWVDLPADDHCQWWHEQPQARPFIRYADLLEQQCRRYESLSADLRKSHAAEFANLKTDLLRFIDGSH